MPNELTDVHSKSTGIVSFSRGVISGESWLEITDLVTESVIETHYTMQAIYYVDEGDTVEIGDLLFTQHARESR